MSNACNSSGVRSSAVIKKKPCREKGGVCLPTIDCRLPSDSKRSILKSGVVRGGVYGVVLFWLYSSPVTAWLLFNPVKLILACIFLTELEVLMKREELEVVSWVEVWEVLGSFEVSIIKGLFDDDVTKTESEILMARLDELLDGLLELGSESDGLDKETVIEDWKFPIEDEEALFCCSGIVVDNARLVLGLGKGKEKCFEEVDVLIFEERWEWGKLKFPGFSDSLRNELILSKLLEALLGDAFKVELWIFLELKALADELKTSEGDVGDSEESEAFGVVAQTGKSNGLYGMRQQPGESEASNEDAESVGEPNVLNEDTEAFLGLGEVADIGEFNIFAIEESGEFSTFAIEESGEFKTFATEESEEFKFLKGEENTGGLSFLGGVVEVILFKRFNDTFEHKVGSADLVVEINTEDSNGLNDSCENTVVSKFLEEAVVEIEILLEDWNELVKKLFFLEEEGLEDSKALEVDDSDRREDIADAVKSKDFLFSLGEFNSGLLEFKIDKCFPFISEKDSSLSKNIKFSLA